MKVNINYIAGGINTYSMICMLVAFMKHHKYEEESDVVMVF
jgi:DNA polymerase sigma